MNRSSLLNGICYLPLVGNFLTNMVIALTPSTVVTMLYEIAEFREKPSHNNPKITLATKNADPATT